MILAHTIEALVDATPVRVQCNTCKSQHGYKANKPATGTRTSSSAEPGTRRNNRYEAVLERSNASSARRYSVQEIYNAGDVLDHPTFGLGIVKDVKDTKVEVQFKDGYKTLIHGR